MKFDPNMLMHWFFWGAYLLVMTRVLAKVLKGRFGKPITASAEVVGKQTVEWFSKYSRNGKHTRYAVTFLVDGKKKSFYVSEFSYGGYRKGEKGKLTYQGDRLIDFS